MKSVAIAAGFAATLAAAHAGHAHHQHAHNKRGADGIFTSWDITTQWEYVTVTAGQAGPAGTDHAQGPAGGQSAAAPSPASSAAQGGNDVSAAAVTSAPSTGGASDPVAAQNSKNAAQASVNAAMASSNSAHQASMLALQAGKTNGGASAPAQNTAAPSAAKPSSSAVVASSSAAAPSQSSGGSSGGAPSGNCKESFMTYYDGAGALGSCGWPVESGTNNTVAMSAADMEGKCGNKLKIYVDGDSTGHEAMITDKCAACASDGHVDVSQGFAYQIAGEAKLVAAGHLPIKYCWE